MISAPWPHQTLTVECLRASLRSGHRRPMVQSPTGSGKTVTAAMIVEAALRKGKRVAVTVPAISLVDQTMEAFYNEGIRECGVIQADHRQTDWSKPVQICSLDTLHKRDALPKVDLVLVDEAHVIKKALLKWIMVRPDMPFIGLSATPWTRGLGNIYDDLIAPATIKSLIAQGFLCPHRTYAPSHPELEGVRTTAGEYNGADLARKANQKALVGDVIETWFALAEHRPTICFAVDCAHARILQERFKDADVSAAYVDHTMPLRERNQVSRDFESGKITVICNVDCLGLGVDLPDIACISYARPTKSIVRWVQNIGRGLRRAEGKDDLLVLDHSDTTLRLGFVDDVGRDCLDSGKLRRDQDREREAPLPKACPQCAYVKPAGVRECPKCGFMPEPQTSARSVDGTLVELDEDRRKRLKEARKRSKQFSMAEKLTVFRMLRCYAQRHGYKMGWAANKYREFFKVWPNGLGDPPPLEPSPEILDWIKSRQIAWAKSKRKHPNTATDFDDANERITRGEKGAYAYPPYAGD